MPVVKFTLDKSGPAPTVFVVPICAVYFSGVICNF